MVPKPSQPVAEEIPTAMENILVDVSQSHGRRPVSSASGVAHTLTTSSQLFSFKHQRLLTPFQHLLLQGYPDTTELSADHSEADVRNMAGEAIALPSLGIVVWGLFLVKGLSS